MTQNTNKEVKHLNDDNFNTTIAKGVTFVDFYADWCGPCRMVTPIIEGLAKEMGDKVTFGKVDIETAQNTSSTYQVTSIPTLILFKNGQEVKRVVGVRDAASLKQMISTAL